MSVDMDRLLTDIDTLSNLGISLSVSTSTPAGEISILFDVIKEKADRLSDALEEKRRRRESTT